MRSVGVCGLDRFSSAGRSRAGMVLQSNWHRPGLRRFDRYYQSDQSTRDEIAARMEAYLLSGRLQPGTKLPSGRQLAVRLGVSRPVIALGKADFARQLMRQHLEFSRTLDTAAT